MKASAKTCRGRETCGWSYWPRNMGNVYLGLWKWLVLDDLYEYSDCCFVKSGTREWVVEV